MLAALSKFFVNFANLPIVLGLVLAPLVFGQNRPFIEGTVTTADGQPLPGVFIYGSRSSCCPMKQESVTTDGHGHFRLNAPANTIHLSAEKYRPQVYVIHAPESKAHITMELSSNELVVPPCQMGRSDQERLGWGQLGPQFDVPRKTFKIFRGEVDTDYIRHVVKAKDNDAFMEFWFGVMAINPVPDEKIFLNSTVFSQRNIVNPGGKVIGIDSWGQFADGTKWRHAAIAGEGGAVYEKVPAPTAELFDGIVSSICVSEGHFMDIQETKP